MRHLFFYDAATGGGLYMQTAQDSETPFIPGQASAEISVDLYNAIWLVGPGRYRFDEGEGVHLKERLTLWIDRLSISANGMDYAEVSFTVADQRPPVFSINGGAEFGPERFDPETGEGWFQVDADEPHEIAITVAGPGPAGSSVGDPYHFTDEHLTEDDEGGPVGLTAEPPAE